MLDLIADPITIFVPNFIHRFRYNPTTTIRMRYATSGSNICCLNIIMKCVVAVTFMTAYSLKPIGSYPVNSGAKRL